MMFPRYLVSYRYDYFGQTRRGKFFIAAPTPEAAADAVWREFGEMRITITRVRSEKEL